MWIDDKELDDVDWDEIERRIHQSRRQGENEEVASSSFVVPPDMQCLPATRQLSRLAQQDYCVSTHGLGPSLFLTNSPAPSLQELLSRVSRFRGCQAGQELPPPPPVDRCPGVFKSANWRSCDTPLCFASQQHIVNGQELATQFWYCPACDYREYIPARLLHPRLAFELVDGLFFEVGTAPGAEDCVRACGGIPYILNAVCCPQVLVEADCRALPDRAEGSRFPLRLFEEVVRQVRQACEAGLELLGPGSLIPAPTLSAFRCSCVQSGPEVEDRYGRIPPELEAILLPFQKEGVLFGLRRSGRLLIADEMGVGKTLQAIALMCCYTEEWPVLVVAPASLRLIWAEEVEKWLPGLVRPAAIHVVEGRADRIRSSSHPFQVVITSYEMLQRLSCDDCRGLGHGSAAACQDPQGQGCMAALPWKVVIVDESHTMRTTEHPPDAKHTETVASVIKRARRAILLSGTPSLNRPFDLFRQVDALRPGLLTNCRQQFSIRYCNRRLIPTLARRRDGGGMLKYHHSGCSHASELHALLKQEVMVRRLKAEVAEQLPAKRRQVVRLPKPRPQDWPPDGKRPRPEGEEEDDSGREEKEEEEGGAASQADLASQLSPFHRTALAKLPAVVDWLAHALGRAAATPSSSDLTAKPKFLLFAHHRDVMAKLAEALSGQGSGADWGGAPFVQIDGSTDSFDRRLAVNCFRDDPSIQVALLSVTAAGTGLDFSKASVVVFVELPQEVSLVRQAEDRAHRRGQLSPVNVYFLVSRGTTDEHRWQQLNRSLERVAAVHDGQSGQEGAVPDRQGLLLDAVYDFPFCSGLTQLRPPTSLSQQPDSPEIPPAASPMIIDVDADSPSCEHGQDCEKRGGEAEGRAEMVGSSPALSPAEAAVHSSGAALASAGSRLEAEACTCPQQEGMAERIAAGPLPSPTSQPAGLPARPSTASPPPDPDDQTVVEAFFQVSRHTNRVHMHGEDGNPLGLSLPLDLLLMPGLPASLSDILDALDAGPAYRVKNSSIGVLGAAASHLAAHDMRSLLRQAQEFARQWQELRAIHRSKLCGKLLRCPLEEWVDKVEEEAVAEGAYGTSKERYKGPAARALVLPEGAVWRTVRVQHPMWKKMCDYEQAFIGDSKRLCIMCGAEVASCQRHYQVLLSSIMHLFCSSECERKYCLQANSGALRRELFKLERGVCQHCRLDCHALVQSLRCIEKGSEGWKAKRLQVVKALSGKLGGHGYKAVRDRLLAQALEGNAWHADHIIPVFRGGGLCDLHNLRTLCVACHQDVTAQQAKERADSRRLDGQPPITSFFQTVNGGGRDAVQQSEGRLWSQLSLKGRAALARQKPDKKDP